MKIILKYTLSFTFICTMIASCALKEEVFSPNSDNKNGSTMVIAYVENFSRHDVATKATDNEERKVNNLAMLVFGKPAGLAQGDTTRVLIAEPIYVTGEKLSFVINTTVTDDGNGQYISNLQSNEPKSFKTFAENGGDLTDCRMYIVANINHLLENKIDINSTEKDFLDIGDHILTSIPQEGALSSSIDVPGKGFPMIGWMNVDLSEGSSLSGSSEALTISLKKLFAKVNFKFLVQVNTEEEWGSVKTPYFEPIEWSVHNIPSNYTLRDSTAAHKPVNTVFYTQIFSTFNFSTEISKANKRIENSTSGEEFFDFSFYMPEYKVLPKRNRTSLPSNIETNLRQCHKPTFCDADQLPTYVQIKGKFSNHQGHISEVQYRLYLGQNEIDDFQILRNQELNNIVIIKGLSNHSGGQNQISIDHRVDITSSGYSIAMERETLLDSHFEFRPMDISVQEGAVVVVKLPQNTWFGAERADQPLNTNTSLYEAKGNRKFFTTSLITELGSTTSAKEFVFKGPTNNNDEEMDEAQFKLWFYFDENSSSPYDASQPSSATNKLYREDQILVDYYESEAAYNNGNGTPTKANREFTFRQMNLWVINGHLTNTKYNIEYFEEYLYNYAADDNYGVTTDGMPWGLNGTQLSNKYKAIFANQENMGGILEWILRLFGGSMQGFFNTAFNHIEAYYDFYLSRDNITNPRDYSGIEFTSEIVNKTGINNKVLTLSGSADSAVEYCYNKNKREEDGSIKAIRWYLPAIDETEEILEDGFNYFHVFQSKYYWSSQPAFDKYNYTAYFWSGASTATGSYYKDDLDRARATIVTATTTSENSGVDGAVGTRTIRLSGTGADDVDPGTEEPSSEKITYHPGNQLRTQINRVRCAFIRYPSTEIFGTYNVKTSTNAAGTQGANEFTVTISKSDDLSKGNVKLSNYLHPNYKSTDYPQYATYNHDTGVLTIPMGQTVNSGMFSTITSVLYDGSNSATNQNLDLQYNSSNNSFVVNGNNLNLRSSNNNTSACYIQSFTKAN